MLDDLLNGIANRKHYDHSRLEHHHDRYQDDRYGHHNPLFDLVFKIFRNKAILAVIIVMILIFGALGIWLIVALLPYLGQGITTTGKMLEQQGIKGILEAIMPVLQKIWEGAGK
jgi:hypothetical protein